MGKTQDTVWRKRKKGRVLVERKNERRWRFSFLSPTTSTSCPVYNPQPGLLSLLIFRKTLATSNFTNHQQFPVTCLYILILPLSSSNVKSETQSCIITCWDHLNLISNGSQSSWKEVRLKEIQRPWLWQLGWSWGGCRMKGHAALWS